MENKVLISLILPEMEINFDIFIPVNEVVWKIKKMLAKSIVDITNISFDISGDLILMNKNTGRIYKNNEVVIDTDIRNASELILLTNL